MQPRAWHFPAPLDFVGDAKPCQANNLTLAWRNELFVPPILRPSPEILLPDHCHRGRAYLVLHLIEAAFRGQSSMALHGQSPEIRLLEQLQSLAKLQRQPQGPKSEVSRCQSRSCDRAWFSHRASIVLRIPRFRKRHWFVGLTSGVRTLKISVLPCQTCRRLNLCWALSTNQAEGAERQGGGLWFDLEKACKESCPMCWRCQVGLLCNG